MIPRKALTITRMSGGQYVDGIWQLGTEETFTARCSVQPTSPDDLQMLPEGRRERRAYTLYTSMRLRSVTDSANPDQVTIDGETYEVTAVQHWANGILPHTRVIVTRMEDQ